MSRRRALHGFTLIELIVAIVIFLMFMGAVYGIYSTAYAAMTRTEEQQEVYQTGRVLLAQLSAEVAGAYQPATASTSALIGEDATDGDGLPADTLTLLTTSRAGDGTTAVSDQCQVSYHMADASDDLPGLYVEEVWHPGLEPANATPVRRLLSPLVVGFNCRYLPVGDDWLDAWGEQTTLPMAVRIELMLRAARADAKPIVLVTTANVMTATAPATGGSDAAP